MKKTQVDGIFCGNDLIAFGAIKGLKEKKVKIPEEVKIIGFDDISMSQFIDPPPLLLLNNLYIN